MADKTIGSLPAASALNDTSLLVIEQAGAAMKLTGLLLKQYCQNAIAAQVAQAAASATEANNSATAASGSAAAAAASEAAAALSETAAEVAQAAAEAAQALAEAAKADAITAKTVAVAAKTDAVSAKEAAALSADAAATAKTKAEEAQGNAEASKETAEAWAVGQRDGADVPSTDPAYHNNAKYYAEQAEETLGSTVKITEQSLTDAEKAQARKNIAAASPSGNYVDTGLASSVAAQLIASVGVTDKVPYNFRTSGGSTDIGNRLSDKIVGGTIVWNQLFRYNMSSATVSGVTFTNNGDGTITANGTATKTIIFRLSTFENKAGHAYLLYGCPSGGSEKTYYLSYGAYKDYGSGAVIPRTEGVSSKPWLIQVYAGTTVDNLVFKPQFFDLTKMFGSTIADYLYSLEQTTAGAVVAWFKNLFQKPYYKYNAGELMNVCTNAHITRGFNAYNHKTGNAKLIGGNAYQITGTYTSLSYSTGETISPNGIGEFTPTENGVLTVTGGNATDTCIHIVWSGYRNGEYKPYVEHRYPLSPVELRGIPKLDSANNLYFDGDTYEKDGKVTRRYGIVDMGTLDWGYWGQGSGGNERFLARVDGIKIAAAGYTKGNIVCSEYVTTSTNAIWNHEVDKAIAVHYEIEALWVYDSSYTDAVAFKAAMSGVYLVYELATPTTEIASPFTDPQIVDDFGTEEYVDVLATAETSPRDVAIPVGHETLYHANLRDKLQNLPANANADGLYLVKQTGNKQELIAYAPESELPAVQTEGTYVLKSVSGALTWVAE